MITEWNDKELLDRVNVIAAEVAKEGAEDVAKDAKQILRTNAKRPTGKLESEIEVKASEFKDGGYIVIAQGKGNYDRYYASFVELGTHNTEAAPYLRPALHKNRSRILRKFKERIEG